MPRFNANSKKEAVALAKELLKKMTLPGFEIDVWENLGWHYRVKSAYFSVDEGYGETKAHVYYTAMMNETGQKSACHSSGYFGTSFSKAADPNEAVEKCIKDAYKVHLEIGETLQKICESVDRQVNFYIGIEFPGVKCGGFIVGSE